MVSQSSRGKTKITISDGRPRREMLRKRLRTVMWKSCQLSKKTQVDMAVIMYDPIRQRCRIFRSSGKFMGGLMRHIVSPLVLQVRFII